MRNIIIYLQKSDRCNIKLTIAINFISSKDVERERAMHSRSNNMKFTSYDDVKEVVNELFDSLRSRYLKTSIRGGDFIFWFISTDALQKNQQ